MNINKLLLGTLALGGVVMNQLTNSGLHTNTRVVFLSDNGGPENDPNAKANGADKWPLRGLKNTLFEGGIRVPFVINWPGKRDSGQGPSGPIRHGTVGDQHLVCAPAL